MGALKLGSPDKGELEYLQVQIITEANVDDDDNLTFDSIQSFISGYGFTDTYDNFDDYRAELDVIFGESDEGFSIQSYCGYGSVWVCAYHCAAWAAGCVY